MRVDREHQLYGKIAGYLQENYPDVIYRFDIAADLKLTQGQAAKFRRLHPRRGYPDLFIAKPKDGLNMDAGGNPNYYAGLYLELKAEGNSPFKKDGSLKKDQHLEEQQAMLEMLRYRGYKAVFATGFDEAKKIIDEYLRPSKEEVEF